MPTGKSPHVPLGPPQGKPHRLWLSLLGESDWGPWAQPLGTSLPKTSLGWPALLSDLLSGLSGPWLCAMSVLSPCCTPCLP